MKLFILIMLCIHTFGSILALKDIEEKNKLQGIITLMLAIMGVLSVIFMARIL